MGNGGDPWLIHPASQQPTASETQIPATIKGPTYASTTRFACPLLPKLVGNETHGVKEVGGNPAQESDQKPRPAALRHRLALGSSYCYLHSLSSIGRNISDDIGLLTLVPLHCSHAPL